MFAAASTVFVLALSLFAAASPAGLKRRAQLTTVPTPTGTYIPPPAGTSMTPGGSTNNTTTTTTDVGAICQTGSASCCNSVKSPSEVQSNAALSGLLAALNIDPFSVVGDLGFGCTLSSACAQVPVCCQGTNMNGLVNVGCQSIAV